MFSLIASTTLSGAAKGLILAEEQRRRHLFWVLTLRPFRGGGRVMRMHSSICSPPTKRRTSPSSFNPSGTPRAFSPSLSG